MNKNIFFIGREKEIRHIIQTLEDDRHIILHGKYGMGKTALIRKISRLRVMNAAFFFIDFRSTPNKMMHHFSKDLGLRLPFKSHCEKMPYKALRHRVCSGESLKTKPIVVLDNIDKLTPQKTILLRHLTLESRYQFIAVAEQFLSARDLLCLQTLLYPAELIHLKHLTKSDSVAFFRFYAHRYRLNWSQEYLEALSFMTQGYPLGMHEIILKLKGEQHDTKI